MITHLSLTLLALAAAAAAAFVDVPYVEDVASVFVYEGVQPLARWGVLPIGVSAGLNGAVPGRAAAGQPMGHLLFGPSGVTYCNFTSPSVPTALAGMACATLLPATLGNVSAVAVDGDGVLVAAVTPTAFTIVQCTGAGP